MLRSADAALGPWWTRSMNPFKKSDREFVDALRRTERFRRPVGVAFIVLGLAVLGFHFWIEVWTKDKALKLASPVAEIQRMVPSNKPDQAAPLAYAVEFRSGLLLSQGIVFGSLMLAAGVRLRFGGRKDR